MSIADTLNLFVKDALLAGRSRSEIRKALNDASWSNREIDKALADFADVDFLPPIPKPRPQITPRDVFIYALMFTALGFTAIYLIDLVHSSLHLWLPDAAGRNYKEARAIRSILRAISILVVSTPLFIWLTIKTNRYIAEDVGRKRSLVRKWLTYLTLFIAALVFFGDISTFIYNFLNGEFTLRLALKAATVAIVSAAIFIFYLRDIEDTKDE